MINVLKIICTLLMLAGIYFVIKKKLSIPISFTILGFIGIVVGGLINGTLPLGEAKSTGYLFFDLFEYFKSEAILANLSSVGMNMFAITGYVYYMNHIKASTLFALIIVNPLKKIKNKYVLAGMSYLLTALMFLVIPNGLGRIALLLGITFPVMVACGISKATAAVSIFAAIGLNWGPANVQVLNAYAFSGMDASSLNLVEFFATTSTPWSYIAIALSLLTFIVTSIIFDKKEAKTEEKVEVKELPDMKSLGIPMWWAIFPILPLIMILFFSNLVPFTPNLGIPCVEYMCFTIVLVLVVLSSKDKTAAFNGGDQLFQSFGNNVANIISIIFGGTVFGKGIQMIGGFDLALQPFMNSANPNIPLFMVFTTVIGVILGFAAASNYVPMSIIGPAYNTMSTTLGLNFQPFALILSGGFMPVMAMGPATSFVALTSKESGVELMTILKRSIPIQIVTVTVYTIGAIVEIMH